MKLAVVILAAGQGVRMRSKTPKVLHLVAGVPMMKYVVEAATPLEAEKFVLVVGEGGDQIRQTLGQGFLYVEQPQQLGTGHAVLQARDQLKSSAKAIMVLYGDTPLITTATLQRLLQRHEETGATLTMLTCHLEDPSGYGRVVRSPRGEIQGIVEEAAASEEQKRIKEINTGLYCFREDWLWPHLEQVEPSDKGEYYLTDLVAMAIEEGQPVEVLTAEDATEVIGVNTRVQLAQAEAIMRDRIREKLMLAGVTMIDPPSIYIDASVKVGRDTVIHPHTFIYGNTVIGGDCIIGPNSLLHDANIGDRCQILASVVEEAILEDGVDVGPFSHLRRGTHLAQGVHVGNFVEVKESYLGKRTKVGHFSYLGDAVVGQEVNIGAGTVTCNYDGKKKHQTIIEDGAFIGSDAMLVAPVRIGAGAKIGAGSVVTKDIPPGSLAYGVPAKVKEKPKRTIKSKEVQTSG